MSGLCRRKCSQVHGPAIWALYRVNQIHVYISYRRAVCMRRCSPHCCRDWQGTPGSLLLRGSIQVTVTCSRLEHCLLPYHA